MRIEIPEFCMVVLAGASGSGKSTFARQHFKATEILSSDSFRGLVSDDETDQSATADAFDALQHLLAIRLKRMLVTVIDATNVQSADRQKYVEIARKFYAISVVIVLDIPEKTCVARNASRPDRDFGSHVVHRQANSLRRGLRGLEGEGFRQVHILKPEDLDKVQIVRNKVYNNKRDEKGPFDIIGDVHGCGDELEELLGKLGYVDGRHPQGRKAIFVGDLVDRGPRVLDTIRLVQKMVESGNGFCVPGNHDWKLMRWLRGQKVTIAHGLQQSINEIEPLPELEKIAIRKFLDSLISHYVFDDGRLVVAHAGIREEMQGRTAGSIREFCLYGETTGETDEFGLPVRHNWAAAYRGKAMVVYGHTPVPKPEWLNNTINIDTGCVFGGRLTALRYPERELVAVDARREYTPSLRPFKKAPLLTAQQEYDDLLDIADVLGKRRITTEYGDVNIREENAIPALEVMSRFAIDPHWLIYLPPTMAPPESSQRPDFLEHPDEVFAYYRKQGVERVICEEKHMGSRAIIVLAKNAEAARARFGLHDLSDDRFGVCYTRTGRLFFPDRDLESAFLNRVRAAVEQSGLFEELQSDWICLDCELMPWSAKAQELLRDQYAAVGTSAEASLRRAVDLLEKSPASIAGGLLQRNRERLESVIKYRKAYRRYCWPVRSVDDLKLAPFHVLASEGAVYADRTHEWHMQMIYRISDQDPILFRKTPYQFVNLNDSAQCDAATSWWLELTERGGEGMVVKPVDFLVRARDRGLVQPAMKCRGREYLRIIYGPEYTLDLDRLRARSLSSKRGLATREFSLGIEALNRFSKREPLRRVHECVFGVLALESESVDPRL